MIVTESGLLWRRAHGGHGPRTEEFVEFVWDGNPRLSRIVQRPNHEEPFVTTYHVQGLAQIYRTVEDALEALRLNP